MSDQMMQEVLKRLDALAEKMGEGAMMAWPMFIKQAFWVGGVAYFLAGVTLAVVSFYGFRYAIALNRKASDPEAPFDVRFDGGLVVAMVSIMVFCGFLSAGLLVFNSFGNLINPQYYALMDLAEMLTGK